MKMNKMTKISMTNSVNIKTKKSAVDVAFKFIKIKELKIYPKIKNKRNIKGSFGNSL